MFRWLDFGVPHFVAWFKRRVITNPGWGRMRGFMQYKANKQDLLLTHFDGVLSALQSEATRQ